MRSVRSWNHVHVEDRWVYPGDDEDYMYVDTHALVVDRHAQLALVEFSQDVLSYTIPTEVFDNAQICQLGHVMRRTPWRCRRVGRNWQGCM